jgi:hypothetical protein
LGLDKRFCLCFRGSFDGIYFLGAEIQWLTKDEIVVFHDHVEYDGDFFRDCRNIEELEARSGVIQ